MLVAVRLDAEPLSNVISNAKLAEEVGSDLLIAGENRFDSFLPLVLSAEHTSTIRIGTGVAIAFPRSPMVTAQIAWELHRFSRGRFILGLGSQVKGHIERRYSTTWAPPVSRMREYILSLRSIWNSFRGTPLNFSGNHYSFNLMPPNFNPGDLDYPDPAIFIGGVNANICQLAGELCDGIFLHPLTSPKYLEQVIWPSLEKGAKKSGRSLTNFEVMGGGFTSIANSVDMVSKSREEIKRRISFYASTRTYQPMLAIHGWQDITSDLHAMSRRGQWENMTSLITDEMVETFAILGTASDVIRKLRERWVGIANGITISIELLGSISQNESTEFIKAIHRL